MKGEGEEDRNEGEREANKPPEDSKDSMGERKEAENEDGEKREKQKPTASDERKQVPPNPHMPPGYPGQMSPHDMGKQEALR